MKMPNVSAPYEFTVKLARNKMNGVFYNWIILLRLEV